MDELEIARILVSVVPAGDYTWLRVPRRHKVAMLGCAVWLLPSLRVNPPMTARHMAHRIHAAYTVHCIQDCNIVRRECRTWDDEPLNQQEAYLRAGATIYNALALPQSA